MTPKTKMLTNDPLTRKRWAKDLFTRIPDDVEYTYLTGSGTDAPVQLRTELGKGEGDEITFGIRKPITGVGVVGDATVEGNEDKLVFKNFKMTIQELNHAVDTGGRMEEQRFPYDLAKEGRDALQEWWGDKLSNLLINCLVGNSAYSFAGCLMSGASTCFANVISEPDTEHYILPNDVAEASQTSADIADLSYLDRLKQRAENPRISQCYKVRPIMIKGKKYYRVLMHNYAFDMLRTNTNVGQWGDLKLNAQKMAIPDVEIEYNGMLISKTNRMPLTVASSADSSGQSGVYRLALFGAQACCWAWGGAGESKGSVMSFVPYTKDAGRFLNIRGGGIFGMEKVVFEGYDFGVITGAAWANPIE